MKFVGLSSARESSRVSRAGDSAADWDAAAGAMDKEQPGVFFTGDDSAVKEAFGDGPQEAPVVAPVPDDGAGSVNVAGQPFVHEGLAAVAEGGTSGNLPFLGTRWRDIPDEQRVDAWQWLRSWVDWFTLVYRVQKKHIPPCWFMHTDVVEELWIAANAERKVWEEGEPSVMPLTSWQNFVPGILGRLEPMVQRCVNGEHVEDKVYEDGAHPFVRRIDEAAWANTVTASMNEAELLEPGVWRAVVVDSDDEVLAQSVPLQVDSLAEGDSAGIGQIFVGPGGRGFVRAWGQDGWAVQWEKQQGTEWVADELKTTSMVSAGDGLTDDDLREMLDERLKGLIED